MNTKKCIAYIVTQRGCQARTAKIQAGKVLHAAGVLRRVHLFSVIYF